jgi:hypothetical protein
LCNIITQISLGKLGKKNILEEFMKELEKFKYKLKLFLDIGINPKTNLRRLICRKVDPSEYAPAEMRFIVKIILKKWDVFNVHCMVWAIAKRMVLSSLSARNAK